MVHETTKHMSSLLKFSIYCIVKFVKYGMPCCLQIVVHAGSFCLFIFVKLALMFLMLDSLWLILGVDSFYEYLFKAHILFGKEEFWRMFHSAYLAVQKYFRHGPWYCTDVLLC